MVLQIRCVVLVFVSGFRNCVTSKDFVHKQLLKQLHNLCMYFFTYGEHISTCRIWTKIYCYVRSQNKAHVYILSVM